MTQKQQKALLGEATKLIDDKQYYPHYINRMQTFPYLWALSIKIAHKQNNPNRYFATQWSNKNLNKTVNRLTELSAKGILKMLDDGIRISDESLNQFIAHMPTHLVKKRVIYYKVPNKTLLKMLPSELYQSITDTSPVF